MALSVISNQVTYEQIARLPEKTVAEFFAGIGLVRMALEHQGWRVVFANDNDPGKQQIYKGHFETNNAHFHADDVNFLPTAAVPTTTLATASFPCNDLSLAGARDGLRGAHSSAFWGFIRILQELGDRKPLLVLLENVPGLLTSHKGADLLTILQALNELGYVVDTFMLDAASFVPQSRQRLFIVGSLSAATEGLGEGCQSTDTSRPKTMLDFIRKHPELRWHIRPLPAPPQRVLNLADILEDLPNTSPEWWSAERAEYLLNQMSPRHRQIADKMIAGPEWSYGTVFRRMREDKALGKARSTAEMRTDGIAGCLRTPRGGSAKQILFRAGGEKYAVRYITAREAARLQGAGEYRITVPRDQALFGFGDAVCVPVIEWIAAHYLNPVVSELMRGHPLQFPGAAIG